MGMVTPAGPGRGTPRAGGGGRRRDRGHVLVAALVVLVLLGAAFSLLAALLVSRMNRVRDEVRRTELTAMVDGAMAETLANLATSPVYPGVGERDLGRGTVRSEVRHGAGGSFVIRVQARLHGATLTVEARGRSTETGPRVTSWRRVAPGGGDDVRGGRTPPPGRPR